MFKNAKNCAIDRKMTSADCAPSYFGECLLYNAPDQYFTSNRQQTFLNVLNYLTSTIQVDRAFCQNQQVLLFGNTPEHWDVSNAAEFVAGLNHFWSN
jgi:hypothetical protein